jgi:hypothetical protein
MVRAVLKNGVIHPLDPLPPEWTDGRELQVEDAEEPDESPEALDRWYQELEASVANIDPEDYKRLEAVLAEADARAKEMVRREMGLP